MVHDQSLDLLTCSPTCYCAKAAPSHKLHVLSLTKAIPTVEHASRHDISHRTKNIATKTHLKTKQNCLKHG